MECFSFYFRSFFSRSDAVRVMMLCGSLFFLIIILEGGEDNKGVNESSLGGMLFVRFAEL